MVFGDGLMMPRWTTRLLLPVMAALLSSTTAAIPSLAALPNKDQVLFEPESRRITTDVYEYLPSASNPFVFERIKFAGTTVVESGGLDLFFKSKNFFNIHLDESDLVGQVKRTAIEIGKVYLDMQFLLQFLFFKFDVNVSADAVFHRKGASMPLTFKVPVDSSSLLLPGSGALYSWTERSAHITGSTKDCPGSAASCVFTFTGELPRTSGAVSTPEFSVRMKIPQKLILQGFVPQLVRDHRDLASAKGWPIVRGDATPRTGIYFEVSGLAKGTYTIDYEIRL